MPAELINDLYDIAELQAQHDQFIAMLTESKAKIIELNAQRITVKGADLSNFTQETQNLNKAIDQSTASTAKAVTSNQQLTKAQIEAKLANQQRTAAIKEEIVSSQAAVGSYNQLQSQLKTLTLQYKSLSEVEREGAVGKQLQTDIIATNAQLKILDAGLGNFQRNVGNYNNSLGLLSKGIKGFGGLGLILSKTLGIDPEVAQGIQEVGRAIRDIQHARELEEVGLKAEGELYEQTQKKIDATAAALEGETVATETAAGSQAELTGSLEANAVAQTELATKTEIASVALETEAGAAEIAGTATKGFSESLSGGLGGAVVLAIAAIAALVEVVKDYNEGLKNQEEAYKELKIIIGEITSAVKSYEDLREVTAQKELKDLAEQIDLRKAAGISALESLALDKQLATEQLKTANQQADHYNINKTNVANAKADALSAASLVKNAELSKQDLLKKTGEVEGQINSFIVKARVDATNKKIEEYKKEADATKSFYDFINGIYQKQIDATNKIDLITIQTEKLNADDRRALILAEATTEAEIIQSKNAIILSSEKSTLNQRLAALKSNQKEQLSVINATLNNTLNDPTKSDAEKKIATGKANADRIKATIQYEKADFDVKENYRQRNLKAETDYTNAILTEDKARMQNSLTDRYTDLENNLAAIKQFGDDQNAILFNNEQLQLQKLGLTKKEQKDIEEKYNSDVLANNIDTNNKLVAVQEKAVSDQVSSLKYLHDQKIKAQSDVSQTNQDISDTVAINKAMEAEAGASAERRKKIDQDLQTQLTDIDKSGELERLNNEIDELQEEYDFRKATNTLILSEEEDFLARLAALRKKAAQTQKEKDDADAKAAELKRNEYLDKLLQVEVGVLEDIGAIGDRRFQLQKDQAQKESDLLDQQTQRQIDAENASADSTQDKAAKIAIINARALAEKQALNLRERKADHDKAKFDKEIAILEAIAAIAVDIAKGKFFEAGLAGLALIKLIATPIPAYRHGRGEGKAEFAHVGEGGVSEYIHRADGTIEKTPAVETLTHLMPKDRVYPSKEAMMKELALSSLQLSDYRVHEGGGIQKADMERMTSEIVDAVGSITFHATILKNGSLRAHAVKMRNYDAWVEKYIKN